MNYLLPCISYYFSEDSILNVLVSLWEINKVSLLNLGALPHSFIHIEYWLDKKTVSGAFMRDVKQVTLRTLSTSNAMDFIASCRYYGKYWLWHALYKALNLFRHQAQFFLAVTLFDCNRAAWYMNSAKCFLKSWFSCPLVLPTFSRNTKHLVSPKYSSGVNTAFLSLVQWCFSYLHASFHALLQLQQVLKEQRG